MLNLREKEGVFHVEVYRMCDQQISTDFGNPDYEKTEHKLKGKNHFVPKRNPEVSLCHKRVTLVRRMVLRKQSWLNYTVVNPQSKEEKTLGRTRTRNR